MIQSGKSCQSLQSINLSIYNFPPSFFVFIFSTSPITSSFILTSNCLGPSLLNLTNTTLLSSPFNSLPFNSGHPLVKCKIALPSAATPFPIGLINFSAHVGFWSVVINSYSFRRRATILAALTVPYIPLDCSSRSRNCEMRCSRKN